MEDGDEKKKDSVSLDSDLVEKLFEKLSGKSEKAGGDVKTALIAAIAAVIGGVITLYGNFLIEQNKEKGEQTIERQKFDAELIKLALQPATTDDRLNFLDFMVRTHLILDAEVRVGVQDYVRIEETKKKGQVPRYIGVLSAVNQPEDAKTLLDQYQTIRATEPSGDKRTFEMTVIMNKLIALMNDVKEFPVEMAFDSKDEREHLSGVAYLYANPDTGKLDALIHAMINEEQPFIQFWGIQAIGNIVKAAGNKVTNETNRLLKELLQKVDVHGDTSRHSELNRIIKRIPLGNSLPDRTASGELER
jgi:hypothetical protein